MADISIYDIIKDPVFILVTTAIGVVAGYVIKALCDMWTAEVQHRDSLADHVVAQIEKNAPAYYLMGNYAHLFSTSLNGYIEVKRQLQMWQIDFSLQKNDPGHPAQDIEKITDASAKENLFHAAKLYSVMTSCFWDRGGSYILPDRWANQAITDLHNELMTVFRIRPDVMLKYVNKDTKLFEFYQKLAEAETDPKLADLKESYRNYRAWIQDNNTEVKKAAACATAYGDLFQLEMKRLYKDWYERGIVTKTTENPLEVPEVTTSSEILFDETRLLIRRAAERRLLSHCTESRVVIREVATPGVMLDYHVHIERGWQYYADGLFDEAIGEYRHALDHDPGDAVAYNNLGNAYAAKKDFRAAMESFERAIALCREGTLTVPEGAVSCTDIMKGKNQNRRGYRPEEYGIVLYNAGVTCYTQKSYDDAIRYLKNSIEVNKSAMVFGPLIHQYLGWSYKAMNRWTEAVDEFHKAATLVPASPYPYIDLARTFTQQGKTREAEWAYRRAIERSEKRSAQQAEFYADLAGVLDSEKKGAECVDAYLEAASCTGGNSGYTESLIDAWTRHMAGMTAEDRSRIPPAIEARLNSRELDIPDPVLSARLKSAFGLKP